MHSAKMSTIGESQHAFVEFKRNVHMNAIVRLSWRGAEDPSRWKTRSGGHQIESAFRSGRGRAPETDISHAAHIANASPLANFASCVGIAAWWRWDETRARNECGVRGPVGRSVRAMASTSGSSGIGKKSLRARLQSQQVAFLPWLRQRRERVRKWLCLRTSKEIGRDSVRCPVWPDSPPVMSRMD